MNNNVNRLWVLTCLRIFNASNCSSTVLININNKLKRCFCDGHFNKITNVPLTEKKKVQTWGRRWRGGCAERCLWAAARSALRSGCGRPTAAAGSWRRRTEAAGWELAGAATAQCCPLLERSPGRRERSRAFRTQRRMIPSGHIVKTLIRASQWGKSFTSASD